MTVVVTGSTGHIGANLVRTFLDQKRPLRALIHEDTRGIQGLDIERVQADILDYDSLRRAFEGAEVVYHLAAFIGVDFKALDRVNKVNVEGTRNVVDACLDAGVKRLIHVSSTHACCQSPMAEVIDETRPLADRLACNEYDRSKAMAERAVRKGIKKGLDAVIVIPSGVLGPYDFKPSHMGRGLMLMARGWLPAYPQGGYNWVDVRDVVDGMIRAEGSGKTGERYLLTGHWQSVSELAGMIADVTGGRFFRPEIPLWLAAMAAPAAERIAYYLKKQPLFTLEAIRILGGNSKFTCEKAEQELGYSRRSSRETIADSLEWFQSHSML